MNIYMIIAQELGVGSGQVEAAVKLLDEGCTVPFIARYRKEATGSLNDEQLRTLSDRLQYLRSLEDRRQTVLAAISEQGKLTDELKEKIEGAQTLVALEDLYLPYRPKRRTRASIAKEKGLEPLADLIAAQELPGTAAQAAEPFVKEDGAATVEEALKGAQDILAERLSEDSDCRTWIRERTRAEGILTASARDPEERSVYETYYEYEEPFAKAAGHRILALNRGEKEKFLTVKIKTDTERMYGYLTRVLSKREDPETTPLLEEAAKDSYDRLIAPAIERELRNELTERAQDGAIHVFGKNLTQLLMQPPLAGHVVLGWDPAFRTGCKLAVTDPTGKVLDTAVIYPTAPTNPVKIASAKDTLSRMIRRWNVTVISVGNGTASRESEQFIAEYLHEIPEKVQYVIVNEAGASVYSASSLATEEFPEFDVGQRSAASIARRLQDPLAELVKIDPGSIGVGQYQHDMDQKKLGEALGGTVEDCVNKVGVDLNTASVPLLSYVSGVSKTVAKNIVSYREANGAFGDRRQLLKVPKLGPKAFEQCAGFVRIKGGDNPLDNTGVHPESYEAAERLLEKLGYTLEDAAEGKLGGIVRRAGDIDALAAELGIGAPTLKDILTELEKPGRDPREDIPKPVLRSDVLEMKDLHEGMILTGTVRNVIDFGAFVDIGVHQDGLVHISQMKSGGFVKHPLDVVSVGDIVEVRVLDVDEARKRISLSMILDPEADAAQKAAAKAAREAAKERREKGGRGQSGERPRKKDGARPQGRGAALSGKKKEQTRRDEPVQSADDLLRLMRSRQK